MADQEEQLAEPENNKPKVVEEPEKHHRHKLVPAPPLSPPSPAHDTQSKDSRKVLCTAVTVVLLLAGISLLIVWLIFRPHKPRFMVVGASIYELNASNPPFLSSSMQFTVMTRNPNRRVVILYDRLTTYVSYRNQEITPPVAMPPLHHKTKTTVSFSPVLGGVGVPVSMDVTNGLTVDQGYGVLPLKLVILGRLRWKAGLIKTGKYSVYVKCDVFVGFKKKFIGQSPLIGSQRCDVDI